MTNSSAPLVAGGAVVLFDFDGVLIRGDAFTLLMCRCYASWRALPLLALLPILLPMMAWRSGRTWAIRFAVRLGLLGMSEARYASLASSFGAKLARNSKRISVQARDAIVAHRAADARVIVVTACERRLSRAVLDALGLHDIELIGSALASGRFALRVLVYNRGPEKARQLAARGILPPWDIAYSDSLDDLPILASARMAVLVNADDAMRIEASRSAAGSVTMVDWR